MFIDTTSIMDNGMEFELIRLCKTAKLSIPNSILKPNRNIKTDYMDLTNQFDRGLIIEDLVIKDALYQNRLISIKDIKGDSYAINSSDMIVSSLDSRYPCVENNNILFQLNEMLYKISINSKPILTKTAIKKCFTARKLFVAKTYIDYCNIDLIVDKNIIDIKSDISKKKIKRYVKQVFIYAIQYNTFIKMQKEYSNKLTPTQIALIESAECINTISIYYWRFNEFFKWKISDIMPLENFNALVDFYTQHYIQFGTKIRKFIEKELFAEK
jgi:hypothetical protein